MASFDIWLDDEQRHQSEQDSNVDSKKRKPRKTKDAKPMSIQDFNGFNDSVDDVYLELDPAASPPRPPVSYKYSGDLEDMFRQPRSNMKPKSEGSLMSRTGRDDLELGDNITRQSPVRNEKKPSKKTYKDEEATADVQMHHHSRSKLQPRSTSNDHLSRSNHRPTARRIEKDATEGVSPSHRPRSNKHLLSKSEHGHDASRRRHSPTTPRMGGGRRARSLRHLTLKSEISPLRKIRSISPKTPPTGRVMLSSRSLGTVDSGKSYGTSPKSVGSRSARSIGESKSSYSSRRAISTTPTRRRIVSPVRSSPVQGSEHSPRPLSRRHASLRPKGDDKSISTNTLPGKSKSERHLSSESTNSEKGAHHFEHQQQQRRPSSDRCVSTSRKMHSSPTRTSSSVGRTHRHHKTSYSLSPATTRPRVAASKLTAGDAQPCEDKDEANKIRRIHRRRASTGTQMTSITRGPSQDNLNPSHQHSTSNSTRKVIAAASSSSHTSTVVPKRTPRLSPASRRSSNPSSRTYHAAIGNIDMDPFAIRS